MIHMELMFVKFKFLLFFLCIANFPSSICWKEHFSPLDRDRHKHRENTTEDKGRDQGDDTAISQGCQRLPANPQKLGKRQGTHFSSQHSERTNRANILISDFYQNCETILLFKPHRLWSFFMAALGNQYS